MIQKEIALGRFRLSLTRRELRCDGTPVPLSSRAIDILCELAGANGAIVSKGDLMARVWRGMIVGENNLQVHISALRKALEKNADGHGWIVTEPGRGYRLLPPVEPPPAAAEPAHEARVPTRDTASLAVLPFRDVSSDPERQHLGDGLVEEIITAVSRIRWLRVASRNMTFAYNGRNIDPAQIGRELAVRYVLEGSVSEGDGQTRITAQLTDPHSGRRIWSDTFEAPLGHVLDLRTRVASRIAGAVEPALLGAEAARSMERPAADLTPYDLYVRAHMMAASSARRIPEALGLLGQAIMRDQHCSPALARAAYCHYRLVLDGRSDDPAVDRREAIELARRALEAGRDDPDTLACAAQVLAYFGGDINAMTALVDRALTLNPNFVRGWHSSADVRLNAGQLNLAIAHIDTAWRLNPGIQDSASHALVGAAHFLARRFNEAVTNLLLAIQADPSSPVPYRYLAACYAHMDRPEEAREIVQRLGLVSSIAIPDASHLRNIEHRQLFLSGLRLAIAADDGTKASRHSGPAHPSMSPSPRGNERRQVTVLCCELVNDAPDADAAALEDLSDATGDFQHTVSEVADRHRGFVYRDLGSSALVLFGYPDAHEHDAEQAVHAGLQLRAALRTMRMEAAANLRCRTGIATGMVVITDPVKTDAVVRRESIVGDPVTLAVRLAALAESDGVAIEPITRRLIGGLFDCAVLGTTNIPSCGQPAPIWQVVGESAVASRFVALRGPVLTPLVGRDEVMDLLSRRWARAQNRDGQAVLITGEAGIGKSRIAMEMASRLSDQPHTCLRYFCSPYHSDSALFPIIEQLAHTAKFSRNDSPTVKSTKLATLLGRTAPTFEDVALIADLLALPPPDGTPLPNLSPRQKKARALEALIRLLESLTRRQPTLLIFEDAQWIDPTSRDLLDMALERIRSLPALLIVTSRPEFQLSWAGQEQVSTVVLNRLDRHDRTALAEHTSGGKALPDEVTLEIAERSDGVPLFVEELTKSILESGLLREEADHYALNRRTPQFAIPTTLRASLMTRLDHLMSARQVAQIGAAIGRTFSYPLLRIVCSLSEHELNASLEQLVASQLVFQRGTPPDAVYTFKHALVQDAAHASLLRNARRQLHARIAEAYELEFPELMGRQPEILARHYAEAENFERSVTYWGLAGRRSVARSAITEAAAQFQKGLDQLACMPDHPDRQRRELEFYSSLGALLLAINGYAAPETGHAYDSARDLWEQLGYPSAFFGVPFGQLAYHAVRAEFDKALRLAEDMLRLSHERHDPSGLVMGHFAAGACTLFIGRFDLSISHFEQGLALCDKGVPSTIAHQAGFHPGVGAQAYLAHVRFFLGFPDDALTRCQRAIAEATRLAHPPTLALSLFKGTMLLSLFEDTTALAEAAAKLVAVATEHGFRHWRAAGRLVQGWTRVKTGDVPEGVAQLRSGLTAYRAAGAELGLPRFIDLLATACEAAGDDDEATSLLDEALGIVERTGECWFVAELKRHKGCLLLRRGHAEAAESLFCGALTIAREQQARLWELRAATSMAQLLGDQGRFAKAHALLAPVHDWFSEGFATSDLKASKMLLHRLAVQKDQRRVAMAPGTSASRSHPGRWQYESALQCLARNRHGRQ